uniref:Self-incompatibility-linked fibrinogen-like protein-A n=1 Tax=Ciona intestinalis TaxID=7719 RepID=A0A143RFP0_CIOIN|nr:self-incompatibility-linked fibrinogen-like protein-A [Ciona intestinalis]
MLVNMIFIFVVLFKVNGVLAYDNTLSFTSSKYYEQTKISTIVRMLSNVKNLRQKQRTTCPIFRSSMNEPNTTSYTQHSGQDYTLLFKDCSEIYKAGSVKSDVYPIWVNQLYKYTFVYCDMDVKAVSNKTGWIIIQRRINGEINFNRGWQNYVDGFGNVRGEHWVGLEHIHALSNQNTSIDQFGSYVTPPRMRIDFEDQEGVTAYAEYEQFKLVGANQKYRLIAAYIDKATAIPLNVSSPISNYWFSTFDNNNAFSGCPRRFKGGWWFLACGKSNLNGQYPNKDEQMSSSNIYWYYWYIVNKNNTALKTVSMKFQY